MTQMIRVSARRIAGDGETSELVLTHTEDPSLVWSKRYHGDIFLGFDAQALGLLEWHPVLIADRVKSRLALRPEGVIDLGLLEKLRFTKRK